MGSDDSKQTGRWQSEGHSSHRPLLGSTSLSSLHPPPNMHAAGPLLCHFGPRVCCARHLGGEEVIFGYVRAGTGGVLVGISSVYFLHSRCLQPEGLHRQGAQWLCKPFHFCFRVCNPPHAPALSLTLTYTLQDRAGY